MLSGALVVRDNEQLSPWHTFHAECAPTTVRYTPKLADTSTQRYVTTITKPSRGNKLNICVIISLAKGQLTPFCYMTQEL